MDADKARVLREIDYEINPCCGLCQHATFYDSFWGTCNINQYQHEKHTGEKRQLSINAAGVCPKFEALESAIEALHGYKEFVK